MQQSRRSFYWAQLCFFSLRSTLSLLIEIAAGLSCRLLIGLFTANSILSLSYLPLLKLIFINWLSLIVLHESCYLLENSRFFLVRCLWRVCLLICGLVTAAATLYQIGYVYHFNLWQSVLTAIPMGLVLWFFLSLALSTEPRQLQAAFPWRRAYSKNVTVFYLAKNFPDDIPTLLENCNGVLDKLKNELHIETELPNISVFLFKDLVSFRRWNKIQDKPYFGMAFRDSIHIVNEPWKRLAQSVVHEFTHIVSWQCHGKNAVEILNEGIAQYMERELVPGKFLPPTPILLQPLCELAGQTFIDLRGDPKASDEAYYHARALVDYLIRDRGLPAFLRAHEIAAKNYVDDGETRLRTAVQEVYVETLEELEDKWRRSCSITDEGELISPDVFSQTAIAAIRTAGSLALQQGSTLVEPAHLMAGTLSQEKSILWDILEFSMAELPEGLVALRNVAIRTELPSEGKPKWNPASRQAINFAFFEARQFTCTYIGTEHLLLGVMRDSEGAATRFLAGHGLTLKDFRDYATAFYKDHRLSE